MESLKSVENARLLHQKGLERLALENNGRNIHPLGALAVVNYNLDLSANYSLSEALTYSHIVLARRLKQNSVLAYKPDISPKQFIAMALKSVFIPADTANARRHAKLWSQAMPVISRPISEEEYPVV